MLPFVIVEAFPKRFNCQSHKSVKWTLRLCSVSGRAKDPSRSVALARQSRADFKNSACTSVFVSESHISSTVTLTKK